MQCAQLIALGSANIVAKAFHGCPGGCQWLPGTSICWQVPSVYCGHGVRWWWLSGDMLERCL